MSKTISLNAGWKRIERTFRVERECPKGGIYSLKIHRESQIVDDTNKEQGGKVEQLDAFNESLNKVMTMQATKDYIKRMSSISTPDDALESEKKWYDDLVTERQAELVNEKIAHNDAVTAAEEETAKLLSESAENAERVKESENNPDNSNV